MIGRLSCLLALCLCVLSPAPARADDAVPITVYAAASLKESLDEVAAAWTRRSGQPVRISYAATSLLARQIEQGAAVDVMISADAAWMDHLQERGLLAEGSRVDLLRNRLVLIAPAASPLAPFDLRCGPCWRAALGDDRLSLAQPESVPAGRYAREALERLGVWGTLDTRLAQSDNVRSAMAFVALGEAPLGIVYATDAKVEPRVRVVAPIPANLHAPIVYPYAGIHGATRAASAGFRAFVGAAEARLIFERAGFEVITRATDVQR